VLSALPIVSAGNFCCCLWVISGGVLAAYLEQQRDPTPITVGRGAFNGLLSGLLGAVVWLVVAMIVTALMAPLQQRFAGEITRGMRDLPPEVRTMLEWFAANPSVGLFLSFFFRLFTNSIFATLGGVLGAAFFRNDVAPALGGPPPPLPPP